MLDTERLAKIAGVANDDDFKLIVTSAVSALQRMLGYKICGDSEPTERTFNFVKTNLWQRVNPFYSQPEYIKLVAGNQEIDITDYVLSQNGNLSAYDDWFNMFKICENCCNLPGCLPSNCQYIKIKTRWGFCAPYEIDNIEYCCIPDDLFNLIGRAIKEFVSGGDDGIKSENTQTRSYTLFEDWSKSFWERNASYLKPYITELRFV